MVVIEQVGIIFIRQVLIPLFCLCGAVTDVKSSLTVLIFGRCLQLIVLYTYRGYVVRSAGICRLCSKIPPLPF